MTIEQNTSEKPRTFRPSLTNEELAVLIRALRARKLQLEDPNVFNRNDAAVKSELGKVSELWANLLGLAHGKKVGRRFRFAHMTNLADDALVYYKIIKPEWVLEQ
jgi:hypothetical protein